MIFYLGTHMLSHAGHFKRCFISANRLRGRVSDFNVNDWIMDSGAFTEIAAYGEFRTSVGQYAAEIERWQKCGNFELAVTQDYMCEPFMVKRTGLSVVEHQRRTIERYDELTQLVNPALVLPVLQGFQPDDYRRHIEMYGPRLSIEARCGVGSVCKRNTNPAAIVAVLSAIKQERPDLKLHGFGLKKTALQNAYITSLLYSADSMAWSFAARRQGRDSNGLSEAQEFVRDITETAASKPYQLVFSG